MLLLLAFTLIHLFELIALVIDFFRYLRFYKAVARDDEKDVDSLPWEQTFERFLSSHPTSKEDCDLFVDVLIFLQLYLNVAKSGKMIPIEIIDKISRFCN